MITLYHRADCPFCWKVRIALHELDVPYKEVEIKLRNQDFSTQIDRTGGFNVEVIIQSGRNEITVEAGKAATSDEFVAELKRGLASEGPYLIEALI